MSFVLRPLLYSLPKSTKNVVAWHTVFDELNSALSQGTSALDSTYNLSNIIETLQYQIRFRNPLLPSAVCPLPCPNQVTRIQYKTLLSAENGTIV